MKHNPPKNPKRDSTLDEPMQSAQPLVFKPCEDDYENVNDRKHEKPVRMGMRVAIKLIDKEECEGQDSGRVCPETFL